jgi:hypothetical protein
VCCAGNPKACFWRFSSKACFWEACMVRSQGVCTLANLFRSRANFPPLHCITAYKEVLNHHTSSFPHIWNIQRLSSYHHSAPYYWYMLKKLDWRHMMSIDWTGSKMSVTLSRPNQSKTVRCIVRL